MTQSARKPAKARQGSSRAKSAARQPEPTLAAPVKIALAVGGVIWLFVAASMVSFQPADAGGAVYPPNDPVANWCGPVGAELALGLFRSLGWAAWGLLIGLPCLAGVMLAHGTAKHVWLRIIGLLVACAGLAGLQSHMLPNSGPLPTLPGGTVGVTVAAELGSRFGGLGTMLWISLAIGLGLLVAFDRFLWAFPVALLSKIAPIAQAMRAIGVWLRVPARWLGAVARVLAWPFVWFGRAVGQAAREGVRENDLDDEELPEEVSARKSKPKFVVKERAGGLGETLEADDIVEEEDEYEDEEYEDEEIEEEDSEEEEPVAEEDHEYSEEELREKVAALPVRFAGLNKQSATDDDLRDLQGVVDLEGYRFPGLDLLEEPEADFNQKLEGMVREGAEALEHALHQYKIKGEVVGIESGPAITLYDVRLAPGTKVSSLQTVSSDIARSLKAVNIRIVANQKGRDTVGVEVPNPTREKVRLKELMGNSEQFAKMKLPMFLGKDASGDPLIEDLTKMPHMLIAGTTGSGKSVCMNSIIMSWLYTKKPNELKMVLVDPKMVEMSQFKDIPHLMCPVVTEMSKAAAILEWAVKKMDERYELLAEAGCRDITGYNALEWDELKERFAPPGESLTPEEEAKIPRRLPYMVFIIDELADLMMTNKEVEGSIIRIAQKARAVGIHLILATQRPQANVVTGLIKSNMPCRISFKVASGMDSRIVLDQKGGELLLGQGDMLILTPRSSELNRAQGTLVDDSEIRQVARFMRGVAGPTFERQLTQLRSGDADEERLLASENNSSASLAAAQEDPLFDRAVEIVLETKRGSVSLLQRRLAIGYTRASRLIDLMGIAGIISEHKGSVARDVQITPEEWAAIKELNDKELVRQERERVAKENLNPEQARANYESAQGSTVIEDDAHVSGDLVGDDRAVQVVGTDELEARRAEETSQPVPAAVAEAPEPSAIEAEVAEASEPKTAEAEAAEVEDQKAEDQEAEDSDLEDQEAEEVEDEEVEETDELDEEASGEADEDGEPEDEAEDEYEEDGEEDEYEETGEDEEDPEAEYDEEEDEEEYVYVDEDGNEIDPEDVDEDGEEDEDSEEYDYVYVDEDGNEIDPEDVDEDTEVVDEETDEESEEQDPPVVTIKPDTSHQRSA